MQLSYVRNLLMATSGAVLFAFLFIKAQAIDFNQHNRYVVMLRQLTELDTRINQNILESRYGLLIYYEPINNNLKKIHSLQNNLKKTPTFINKQNQSEIHQKLQTHMEVLQEKERLIEDFKSKNAIL